MSTATAPRTRSCDRCGAQGLRWAKSARTGRWYLQEEYIQHGYAKSFTRQRLHQCQPQAQAEIPARPERLGTLYGTPHTVIENPETHVCSWRSWKPFPGSYVWGSYCFGCNARLID